MTRQSFWSLWSSVAVSTFLCSVLIIVCDIRVGREMIGLRDSVAAPRAQIFPPGACVAPNGWVLFGDSNGALIFRGPKGHDVMTLRDLEPAPLPVMPPGWAAADGGILVTPTGASP